MPTINRHSVTWEAPLSLYFIAALVHVDVSSSLRKPKMLLEIQIAASFLMSYLYNKLPRRRVDLFSAELTRRLKEKFEGHWYPDRPSKGSGYRCLLIGDDLDPVLINSADDSGLSMDEIRDSLPEKLTMWIDPDEVSYRIEDQPVVKMIYQKDKYGEQENLAELEAISVQQQYSIATSSPCSNSKTSNQGHCHSSSQNSPVSQISPLSFSPRQANYSLWSTQETTPTRPAEVDSRLSPNAQEFTYPVSKQSTSLDYLYRQDTSSLNSSSFASNPWGSPGESIDRFQGLSHLYGWLNMDNVNYKRNYTSSQLEIMA